MLGFGGVAGGPGQIMAFLWRGDATYMYVGLRGVAGNDISVGEIDCTLVSVLVRITKLSGRVPKSTVDDISSLS